MLGKIAAPKLNVRELRRKTGLNQLEFWAAVGVTQSGGSRYESGRNMPKPVRELLRLVYIEQIDLTRIRGQDVEIIEYMKETHPDLYKSLGKAVKALQREATAKAA